MASHCRKLKMWAHQADRRDTSQSRSGVLNRLGGSRSGLLDYDGRGDQVSWSLRGLKLGVRAFRATVLHRWGGFLGDFLDMLFCLDSGDDLFGLAHVRRLDGSVVEGSRLWSRVLARLDIYVFSGLLDSRLAPLDAEWQNGHVVDLFIMRERCFKVVVIGRERGERAVGTRRRCEHSSSDVGARNRDSRSIARRHNVQATFSR